LGSSKLQIWLKKIGTLNELNEECVIVTGLITAACDKTVVPASKGYSTKIATGILGSHSPMLKAHNGNGFKSPNSSLNGVYTSTTTNGVCVDGSC